MAFWLHSTKHTPVKKNDLLSTQNTDQSFLYDLTMAVLVLFLVTKKCGNAENNVKAILGKMTIQKALIEESANGAFDSMLRKKPAD